MNVALGRLRKRGLFSKILVAVDGSAQSMAAARRAMQMAERDKSKVIALHVIEFSADRHYVPEVFNEILQKGRTNAEKWFSDIKMKADGKGIRLKTKVIESIGSPAPAIVRFAEKEEIDLVVIGTKGRTELTKRIGSTALGVVMHAPCTVMIVRK